MPPEPHPAINPLSVQAASLVRNIDALSSIFWLCLLGFFLSIFFAGLLQLEGNTYTDAIFLGEYQVPKAILPLFSLAFAVFAFWLVSNRLSMLAYVIGTTTLTRTMVHDLFHLNPPVLHVFDKKNADPWAAFSGVSVFMLIWAVFFGNTIALIWSGAVQLSTMLAEFDPLLIGIYAIAIVGVITYGVLTIVPTLRAIIASLHHLTFRIGWPRHAMAVTAMVLTFIVNQWEQLFSLANAVDGETLFMNGIEINLFGIDAVERDQICQDKTGQDYGCGHDATQALQQLVQSTEVVCLPIVNIDARRALGVCELVGEDTPTDDDQFTGSYRPNNLSRIMIEEGHAISIGIGQRLFEDEQRQAQTLRRGIWQGSFMPPRSWRSAQ